MLILLNNNNACFPAFLRYVIWRNVRLLIIIHIVQLYMCLFWFIQIYFTPRAFIMRVCKMNNTKYYKILHFNHHTWRHFFKFVNKTKSVFRKQINSDFHGKANLKCK